MDAGVGGLVSTPKFKVTKSQWPALIKKTVTET